jgi:hypothetical protein
MEPFKVSTPLLAFNHAYPSAQRIVDVVKHGGATARVALIRLWLSEGIPFAFRECPAVYEAMRSWLSNWLDVHAKEICISGSARIGVSLAPRKFGNPFDKHSDLDLFVVSSTLFHTLKGEFIAWSDHYDRGEAVPHNSNEERYWKDNYARGHQLLQRGFIDQSMIPNRDPYPVTRKVSQCMWNLIQRLHITSQAPRPTKASVRCYASWESFVSQMDLNLRQLG